MGRLAGSSSPAATGSSRSTGLAAETESSCSPVVDVNDLKEVNDRDGHAAGDELLQIVVTTIQTHLRPYDPVIRIGGDEFVCGLTDSEPEVARGRFQEIQTALAQATPPASISFGLAALRPEDTLQTLMKRADSALYAAKHTRRR